MRLPAGSVIALSGTLVGVFLGVFGAALTGCGGTPPGQVPAIKPSGDTSRAHRDAVQALVQPLIDAEITTSIVVGLYDGGKTELYGFGTGPGGTPPTGTTLFELGSVTQVYTALLFADAIQKREVSLDTALSDLLPPGVTAPSDQGVKVSLGMLATHTSGFPQLPPSLTRRINGLDPYKGYNEELLYRDLIATSFVTPPGSQIGFSSYGVGVLGFVLGKKLGVSYETALTARVLEPLGLASTFFVVPPPAQARRMPGRNADLVPAPFWTWDAMSAGGGLISSAQDQLTLIDAELDAASGSKLGLRAAMRLTQEQQVSNQSGPNEGLGWEIDAEGKFWHNGGTGGFRSFVGFDPKTRRGVVILSASAVSLVDHIALDLYKVLAKTEVKPVAPPQVAALAQFAGTYQLGEFKLVVAVNAKRVTITGQGEQPLRLIPISDHEMWFEAQQAVVVFEREGDKVVRAVFVVGAQRLAAQRIAD
jgi:D-alanyl-D-alanine-carboxypeptidase/D-alanyl-D-alanine-endopeptidase